MSRDSRPVYSTQSGRLCPSCGQPLTACGCKARVAVNHVPDKPVTLWRERKGRAGKDVTVIRNLPLKAMELKLLASRLKSRCGSGGTVSGAEIEIQGDHRETIKALLEVEGFAVKLAGG